MSSARQKQVYAIMSVDTEHDIVRYYETRTAGWSKGIPLLFEVFDLLGLRGKVCWLIEYNSKEGILALNPDSKFYCKEAPALIQQIKDRGDELGLHPSIAEWRGGDGEIPLSSAYGNIGLWDTSKRYHDPEFVVGLITSGAKALKEACGVSPIGCRSGGFFYATHLGIALQRNGIYIDSSIAKTKPWHRIKLPNAYYASGEDIREEATENSGVLEIPTTSYISRRWHENVSRLRTWYWLHREKQIFLSFFIHNWQAILADGKPDHRFLDTLHSSLRFILNNGSHFLSWTEAKKTYDSIYGHDL